MTISTQVARRLDAKIAMSVSDKKYCFRSSKQNTDSVFHGSAEKNSRSDLQRKEPKQITGLFSKTRVSSSVKNSVKSYRSKMNLSQSDHTSQSGNSMSSAARAHLDIQIAKINLEKSKREKSLAEQASERAIEIAKAEARQASETAVMNSELAVIQAETELAKAKVIAEAFEGLLDDDVGGEFENLAPSLSAHDKVSCYVENLVQPAQQVSDELGLQNNDKSPKVEANDVMTTGPLSSTNHVSMINVTLSDIAHATDLTNSASLQMKLVSSAAPENYLFSSHNIQCHSQNPLRDVLSNTVIDPNLRTHIPSTMVCQCTTVTGGVTSTLSAYAAPCYATPSYLPISSILTSSGPCNLEPTSLYTAVPGSLTQTLPVNHDNVGPARLNTIQNSFTRPCQSVTFAASNISQPSATFVNPPPGFSLQKPLSTHVRVMAPQYSTASLNPMPLPVNDQQSDTKRSSDMKEFAQILVRCQGSRPLAEEQRFDGDPLKYHIFIRQVQDRILRIHGESDPAHALQLLLDSTTGPARKLISNCIMLPDD